MNEYELIKKALKIMRYATQDEKDKSGDYYIFHPITVALLCSSPEAKAAALLHDTIEDHPDKVSFEYLCEEGIPDKIIEAVKLLTHEKDVPYLEYVQKIKDSNNPIALEVKLADLTHNSDLTRIKNPSQKDYDRIKYKYQKAFEILKS